MSQHTSSRPVDAAARRVLRTPEAAAYVGLAPSTLEKMRLTRDGPSFVRLGGRAIGYDIADLDAWLDSRRENGSPSPDASR